MSRLLLALVALLLLLPGSGQAATVRVGLFVGNDVGFGPDEPLQHAEREARDLADVFVEMGGLARERAHVIQGGSAQQVRDAISTIEAQAREIEARGDEVLLLFYYSGHATREGLHMSGTLLQMDFVRRWLETSEATARIAFVDACESGTLARSRGGTPVEAVEIAVDDTLLQSGLAIVTSTGPLSVARESDQFGGGVFSRALMTGLRGAADTDADGNVSLEESYNHVFSQTVLTTAARSSGVQKPEFRFAMEGVGKVVLTRIAEKAAGLVLPEELEGTYTVVSVGSGQVVARVEKTAGELRRLSLAPGRYLVRKVRREDVLVSEVDLVWGGDRWIDDARMTTLPLGDPMARGDWSSRPVKLALHGMFASPIASKNPVMGGGEALLTIRLLPTLGLTFGGGAQLGATWSLAGRLRSTAAYGLLGVQFERRLKVVDLRIGGGATVLGLFQNLEVVGTTDRDRLTGEQVRLRQITAGGYFDAGLHLPVGPFVGLDLGARALLYPVNADDSLAFFVMVQGYGGVTFRFGPGRVARAGKR